jgi:HPt (histidine-containing phosphotransfer) domain-containing protein
LTAIEEFGRVCPHGPLQPEDAGVSIPAGLEQIVPGYLTRRRGEVTRMTSLLAAANYDRLRILGHDLKGSGSSYDFPELTRFGADLEAAAKRADHDTLAVEIMRLAGYLSRMHVVNR